MGGARRGGRGRAYTPAPMADPSALKTGSDLPPAAPDAGALILGIESSCDETGAALVRLPGGYSPNQVAFHIVSQVGDRLEEQVGKGRPTNGAVARP